MGSFNSSFGGQGNDQKAALQIVSRQVAAELSKGIAELKDQVRVLSSVSTHGASVSPPVSVSTGTTADGGGCECSKMLGMIQEDYRKAVAEAEMGKKAMKLVMERLNTLSQKSRKLNQVLNEIEASGKNWSARAGGAAGLMSGASLSNVMTSNVLSSRTPRNGNGEGVMASPTHARKAAGVTSEHDGLIPQPNFAADPSLEPSTGGSSQAASAAAMFAVSRMASLPGQGASQPPSGTLPQDAASQMAHDNLGVA